VKVQNTFDIISSPSHLFVYTEKNRMASKGGDTKGKRKSSKCKCKGSAHQWIGVQGARSQARRITLILLKSTPNNNLYLNL
jgi:hypothetical protein